jgi:hypothetical protein
MLYAAVLSKVLARWKLLMGRVERGALAEDFRPLGVAIVAPQGRKRVGALGWRAPWRVGLSAPGGRHRTDFGLDSPGRQVA